MSEYSGRSGSGKRPDPQKPDNTGWYSWPLVIVLFAIGLWPVALLVMLLNGGKRKRGAASRTGTSTYSRREENMESAVERAIARAEAQRGGRSTAAREVMERRGTSTSERRGEFSTGAGTVSVSKGKGGKKKPAKVKLPGKLLRVLGICLMAVGMIVAADATANLLEGWHYVLEDLFAGLGFLLAGGIMWGRGRYLAQMTRRSQRYLLAIGGADVMALPELAKRVNRTPAQAARELQKLIDRGYLGEDAYVDHQRGYFLRFGATIQEEPPLTPTPAPVDVPKEAEEGYSGVLRSIRRANDRIADEAFSRKIDRLEQISALIFKEVEAHPEKRDRIRTFFDYYLPTTQKLLDAYAEFEETGVEGENLRQAKERIEQTMDAIVGGFEHQLDQLYSADAMDVVSDIKVMETMLQRDTASAAKDFGYDRVEAAAGETEDGEGLRLQL